MAETRSNAASLIHVLEPVNKIKIALWDVVPLDTVVHLMSAKAVKHKETIAIKIQNVKVDFVQ